MASFNNIPAKYKIYVGRIFILRKCEKISASIDKKQGKRLFYDKSKTFGESVFIFDETNSKVKVSTLTGTFLWMPKYFLHKEICTQNTNNQITKDIINKLVIELLSCNLPEENKLKIIQILKLYSDIL